MVKHRYDLHWLGTEESNPHVQIQNPKAARWGIFMASASYALNPFRIASPHTPPPPRLTLWLTGGAP